MLALVGFLHFAGGVVADDALAVEGHAAVGLLGDFLQEVLEAGTVNTGLRQMGGKNQIVGLFIISAIVRGRLVTAGNTQQQHAQSHYHGKRFGQLFHFITS